VNEASYRKSVLGTGITLLSERVPGRESVAVGVWLRSGARDEPGERLGITHFIEHMMFKGTERRDARAIARSLESIGGHLDAFTAREQVCYYARSLAEHLPAVVDVLADIVCRSRMTPVDVTREQSVVREEILAYEDNPEEKVGDLLSEQVWGDHPLGRPILGTTETVSALTSELLRDYFRRRYRPEHLVIAAAGDLEHTALADLIEAHFTPPDGEPLPLGGEPPPFHPTVRHVERPDLQQLYVSLATRGVPDLHPDRYPLLVLTTLLGGGMSSRLFQSVREEAGLAYSVFAAQDFYRDSGMLSIHMGVSPERGREALARTRVELEALRDQGADAEEVEAAKQQIRGGMLMEHEGVSARMVYLAHEEIYRGSFTPPEEMVARVLEVTEEQVADVGRRYLEPSRFALTVLGPAPNGVPLSIADWPVDAAREPARARANGSPTVEGERCP
jgi:predicted Zn-dependent peptidase